MLNERRVLAVVPARGGSKGLPGKNVRPLDGKPLLAHVVPVVEELGFFDRSVVSTDDLEIARVATEAGLEAPFLRPPELSGDLVGDLPVLQHALAEMERHDHTTYDVIVMLQPTSPLRRPEHVEAVVRRVLDGWDAAWTVSPTPLTYHPAKQLALDGDGGLSFHDPRGAEVVARQQLAPVFHRNGAAYAFSRSCLVEQQSIMGRRTAAVVVEERMVSIDTLEDFDRAEEALRERKRPDMG